MYSFTFLNISLFYFLLSPLYAASYTPEPDSSPSLLSRETIDCFPTPHPPNRIISAGDCYQVVRDIYRCPNPMRSALFSHDAPDATYKIPISWKHNNCIIGITMARFSRAYDETSTLATAGTRALAVIRRCVENGGIGGIAAFGERDKLEVFVRGNPIVDNRPPSSIAAAANALALGARCLSGLGP